MKNRIEAGSPVLQPVITQENYAGAVVASSGGCLVADAIKEQYPHLSHVQVDVATVRVTDRAKGERYIYLTPQSVAEMLLAFDQGWKEESLPKKLLIRKAVKIIPVTTSNSGLKKRAEDRAQRLLDLEEKEKSGQELTDGDKRALGKLRNPKQTKDRPTTYGPATAEGSGTTVVIRGGAPAKTHKQNPNLLHGRNRHFGAKSAKPSEVFKKALKEATKSAVNKALKKERSKSKTVPVAPETE